MNPSRNGPSEFITFVTVYNSCCICLHVNKRIQRMKFLLHYTHFLHAISMKYKLLIRNVSSIKEKFLGQWRHHIYIHHPQLPTLIEDLVNNDQLSEWAHLQRQARCWIKSRLLPTATFGECIQLCVNGLANTLSSSSSSVALQSL
jgi:hypothetical protein